MVLFNGLCAEDHQPKKHVIFHTVDLDDLRDIFSRHIFFQLFDKAVNLDNKAAGQEDQLRTQDTYDKKKVDPVLQRILFDREQFAEELKKSACLACKAHPGGPCIPGIKRLFVSVDGTFFPCEKVDETLPGMVIGTIEEGLDIEKMSRVINIGKLTTERCMDCIAFQNCRICIERITGDFDSDFVTPASKQAVCKETIDTFLSMLYQYCIIEECKAGGGEVW